MGANLITKARKECKPQFFYDLKGHEKFFWTWQAQVKPQKMIRMLKNHDLNIH
jgi:hypothetical protein